MEHFAQIEAFGIVWMQICAIVVATGGVIALAVKLYRWLRKPTDELTASREEMMAWFAADKRRIESLEQHQDRQDAESKLMLKALMQLMSHEIDGNHTAQLTATRDEIQEFLIER